MDDIDRVLEVLRLCSATTAVGALRRLFDGPWQPSIPYDSSAQDMMLRIQSLVARKDVRALCLPRGTDKLGKLQEVRAGIVKVARENAPLKVGADLLLALLPKE